MNPVKELQDSATSLNQVRLAAPVACEKCGVGDMVDDSYGGVEVYRCWVCGNRIYAGYPKRHGGLVCSRCGNRRHEENELGYCEDCLKLLNICADRERMRAVATLSARGA